MLEFIVLGQIPGTSLYISFTNLLLVITAAVIAAIPFYIIQTLRLRTQEVQANIEQQTI